jgi:hypothetical protein
MLIFKSQFHSDDVSGVSTSFVCTFWRGAPQFHQILASALQATTLGSLDAHNEIVSDKPSDVLSIIFLVGRG